MLMAEKDTMSRCTDFKKKKSLSYTHKSVLQSFSLDISLGAYPSRLSFSVHTCIPPPNGTIFYIILSHFFHLRLSRT